MMVLNSPICIDFRPFVRGGDAADQERATELRKKAGRKGEEVKERTEKLGGGRGFLRDILEPRRRNSAQQPQSCARRGRLGGREQPDPVQISFAPHHQLKSVTSPLLFTGFV